MCFCHSSAKTPSGRCIFLWVACRRVISKISSRWRHTHCTRCWCLFQLGIFVSSRKVYFVQTTSRIGEARVLGKLIALLAETQSNNNNCISHLMLKLQGPRSSHSLYDTKYKARITKKAFVLNVSPATRLTLLGATVSSNNNPIGWTPQKLGFGFDMCDRLV